MALNKPCHGCCRIISYLPCKKRTNPSLLDRDSVWKLVADIVYCLEEQNWCLENWTSEPRVPMVNPVFQVTTLKEMTKKLATVSSDGPHGHAGTERRYYIFTAI